MFLTTRALVLRTADYKDADRILTVLTEDEGKLTVKARGVMRRSSKIAAACQLLSFSELTLFGNKGKWTVNEAVEVEQFRGLRDDIGLFALGCYFAEVLEAVSDEDCPDPSILQLGLNSLYALSSGLYSPEQVKAAFEMRLMRLSGYEPDLSACRGCGAAEPEEPWLLPAHGELYCGKCRVPGCLELSGDTLAALRHIISAEPKRVFSFSLSERERKKLSAVSEAYALCELDRPFGTLDYYKKVSGK